MSFFHTVLLVIVAVFLTHQIQFIESRNVVVDVKVPWKRYSTSIIAELGEFLSDQSNVLYWNYVDSLCKESSRIESILSHGGVEEGGVDLQSIVFDIASSIAPPGLQSLMDTTLGLSVNLPAVRFYDSLSEGMKKRPCGALAFVVTYPSGQILCTPGDIDATLSSRVESKDSQPSVSSASFLLPQVDSGWDHIYPFNASSVTCTGDHIRRSFVLYGTIGSASFCNLHNKLVHVPETHPELPTIQYAMRHSFHNVSSLDDSARVQGFGVFLDIKNVEYKTGDDAAPAAGSGTGAVAEDDKARSFTPGEEVAGVIFSTLAERRPQLVDELSVLKAELTNKVVEEGSEMKMWQIKELGLQTLAAIMSAQSPVEKLTDIVHNFPLHAPALSSIKLSDTFRAEFGDDSIWQRGAMGRVALNSMYINGIRVDLSGATFNMYDLLKQVRHEMGQLEQLETLQLPGPLQAGLRQAAMKLSAESDEVARRQSLTSIVRVDVSKGGKHVVHFMNNLEKDKVYKSLPKKLSTLLKPSWELHALSRNLYTLIAVADPTSSAGAEMLIQMQAMMQQRYPIRFGFVLYCGHDHDTVTSVQARICRLFSQAKTYGVEEGTNFIMEIANEASRLSDNARMTGQAEGAMSLDTITETKLSRMYSDAILAVTSKRLYANELVSEAKSIQLGVVVEESKQKTFAHQDFVTNTTAYLQARGLGINSFSLNGIVMPADSMAEAMMQLLGREQYILAMAVRSGQLTDKSGSIFNAILEMNPERSYSRYHRILEETVVEYVDCQQSSMQEFLSATSFVYDLPTCRLDDDDHVTSINTVLVLASSSRKGLESARQAIQWVASKSRDYSHRLSVSFLLSEEEAWCVTFVLQSFEERPVTGTVESGSFVHAALQRECRAQLSEDALRSLSHVLAFEVARESIFGESSIQSEAIVDSNGNAVLDSVPAVMCSTRDNAAKLVSILGAIDKGEIPSLPEQAVDTITNAVRRLLHTSSLGKQVVGWIDSDASVGNTAMGSGDTANSGSSSKTNDEEDISIVYYNARKLKLLHGTKDNVGVSNGAKLDAAMTREDYGLLANIEYNRLGAGIDAALINEPLPNRRDMDIHQLAQTYLRLASFIGQYGGSSSVQRSDVITGLAEGGIVLQSNSASLDSSRSTGKKSSKRSTDSDTKVVSGGTLQMFIPPSIENKFSEGLSVIYLVDPLSVAGQRAAALMKLFRDSLRIPQTIILAPHRELTEFPLQNFYRYVLAPHAGSGDGRDGTSSASAVFHSLPHKHTFTTRIDGPEPWNIQAAAASQDIDNLLCKTTSSNARAKCGDVTASGVMTDWTAISYTLKNILFTGSCTQTMYGQPHHVPPNGLQLTFTRVGASSDANADSSSQLAERQFESTDTLVMQNLGYFQMQANPGLWNLNLAVGRARYLYSLNPALSVDAAASPELGKFMAVKSFSDVFYRLVVHKRPGVETIPLLQEADDNTEDEFEGFGSTGGMWDSLTSFFKSPSASDAISKKAKAAAKKKLATLAASEAEDNRIHVFSLATGHMYERLLRIMMLSVTKRTSVPVKFWLLENYLSPTFKEIVAMMSARYGFEVGYVTYKWPEWLRQQTQKQRIIWGYKILFLDVLFPLNVKKVIYVDADQVLRADLKELWDLDLEGKPYAYTPFCTSRAETLGFQFWRSGYWADHLRGKPYHISALYVVDLQKFRRNAVGDALRGIYDGLARDPNSLANLDQDLPNYAQHAVPIHSLPQSWLWCETWCSDESKSKAKTIDLCNNPLHKEPKLDMARRIISGKLFNESWVDLDDEIRRLEIEGGFRQAE